MHYAGARYYMSTLGRWTTTDPLMEGNPNQLMKDGKSRYLGASPYNYTFNNPTNLTDPDGKEACCFLIPPLGLAETPDNVAAIAGNKEAQARVAKREGARLGIVSLFLPGPEHVLLGAAAATKAGRAIAKFGDEAANFVKGLFKGADEAMDISTSFGKKIERQMGKRGWSKDDVTDTIGDPFETKTVRDTRYRSDGTKMDDPATAYLREDGSYVIRNDRTGGIVRVSNRNDPDWKAPWDENQ